MKKLFVVFTCIISLLCFSQRQQWNGYFSYNEIVDISNATTGIVAATTNNLFFRNTQDNTLETFTSINDLKTATITKVFTTSNGNTFVGNKNGLINIIKPNKEVVNKVDIINQIPVPATQKRINNFYEFNNKLYVSTDYGITVFKLDNLEIENTYYIGNSGENIKVFQTTVLNNNLYAVTENQGIKRCLVTNPFIYDFSQWTVFDAGFWSDIVTFNNTLVATNSDGNTYRYNGASFQVVFSQFASVKKLAATTTHLVITTQNNVIVLNTSFMVVQNINTMNTISGQFSTAIEQNGFLYVGTSKNGVFESSITSLNFENIVPQGPIEDFSFRVKKLTNDLWITHGAHDRTYDPNLLLKGISTYSPELGWEIIPATALNGAVSLNNIIENPRVQNEVYVASSHSGLLRIRNKTDITLFNQTNGLESVNIPNYISVRIHGLDYDRDGNLWLSNAFTINGLKKLSPSGSFQNINLSAGVPNASSMQYGNLVVDKNGTKWMAGFGAGVIGFNERYNNKIVTINEENGNLPASDVRCVAVDKRNQLWIGTFKGLRIVSSVDRFITEEELPSTNIVIQEGDLAQELFFQQVVNDIYVDGANNKWVAIGDAGVFQISSNGQQTLQRFTKDNSPLPSNNVFDIDIDEETGEVFFATDKGLVSFLGASTKGSDTLDNVFIYPNPVRPNYTGTVKIAELLDKVNLKITDVEGNLVFETTSRGGTVEWDTTAFGKYKVASGVYMVFITSEDGTETTVKKIMIVR